MLTVPDENRGRAWGIPGTIVPEAALTGRNDGRYVVPRHFNTSGHEAAAHVTRGNP
jgi:hypothetical protein